MGFTRINGGKKLPCIQTISSTGYDIVSYKVVKDFVDVSGGFLGYTKYVSCGEKWILMLYATIGMEKSWNYVEGHCNNSSAKERSKEVTVGMLSDVAQLEYIRASLGYHKLVAIVP